MPTVRPATVDDAAALRTLQQHLDEPAPELLDAALSGLVGDLLVAVPDRADDPVGYLLSTTSPPAEFERDVPAQVHIAELVVAPTARRQGHGSALLATLLSAHPTATVTLTVAADNDSARALYDRFGFEVSERLPGYFADGPGLLLVHRLRTE